MIIDNHYHSDQSAYYKSQKLHICNLLFTNAKQLFSIFVIWNGKFGIEVGRLFNISLKVVFLWEILLSFDGLLELGPKRLLQ